MDDIKLERWNADYVPTEAAILARLRAQGLRGYAWSNGPGDVYPEHMHPYRKVIYVVQGSLIVDLPTLHRKIELAAGDRIELPAQTPHAVTVGVEGVRLPSLRGDA